MYSKFSPLPACGHLVREDHHAEIHERRSETEESREHQRGALRKQPLCAEKSLRGRPYCSEAHSRGTERYTRSAISRMFPGPVVSVSDPLSSAASGWLYRGRSRTPPAVVRAG